MQVAVEHFFGGGDAVAAEDAQGMMIDRFDRASRMLDTGNARDALGELRQGIFVCAKHGVVEGEELCAEKDAPSPPPMLIDDALCKACPRASRPA